MFQGILHSSAPWGLLRVDGYVLSSRGLSFHCCFHNLLFYSFLLAKLRKKAECAKHLLEFLFFYKTQGRGVVWLCARGMTTITYYVGEANACRGMSDKQQEQDTWHTINKKNKIHSHIYSSFFPNEIQKLSGLLHDLTFGTHDVPRYQLQ